MEYPIEIGYFLNSFEEVYDVYTDEQWSDELRRESYDVLLKLLAEMNHRLIEDYKDYKL